MAREIKFRYWDVVLRRYSDPDLYVVRGDGKIFSFYGQDLVDDMVVEQWTGEVDETGVEIYDGDIVEYQFGDAGVVYRDKIGWEDSGWRMISFDDTSSNCLCAGVVTVIGNMRENLDLITK